ncbi:MAG: helix-turn-helix domain-containing protein, partial [Bacteroidota bacterium]
WFIWIPLRLMDAYVYNQYLSAFYYDVGIFILATLTCWIGFKGYVTSQNVSVGFLNDSGAKSNSDFDLQNLKDIAKDLKYRMREDKFYLDSELTLIKLSKLTNYPQKSISRALNKSLNMTFHQFVNAYRVEAFKANLQLEEFKHLSLLGVALESGFGSKSSFNLVFKSFTGLTPNAYKKQLQRIKS